MIRLKLVPEQRYFWNWFIKRINIHIYGQTLAYSKSITSWLHKRKRVFCLLLLFGRGSRLATGSEFLVPPVPKRTIVRCAEPSWHRRERRVRSAARKVIHQFVARPKLKQAERAIRKAILLEHHHSKPYYVALRRTLGMSQWNSWDNSGRQWSYWGSKPKKGKGGTGAAPKKAAQKKGKGKSGGETSQSRFPGYDSMALPSQSSSTSPSFAEDSNKWQQALFELVKSNPQLTLPEEIKSQLTGVEKTMEDTEKEKLYQEQRLLNAKRKAYQKLERLELALKRKKLQMVSYQEEIKKQLQMEMQRFQKETIEIEQNLKETQKLCERLEKGEMENPEDIQPFMDTGEDLATMLGLAQTTPESSRLVAQLQKEKREVEQKAMLWKTQFETLASGSVPWRHSPSAHHGGKGPPMMESPQLPDGRHIPQKRRKSEDGAKDVEVISDSPTTVLAAEMD